MSMPERAVPVFTITRVSRSGGHVQASRYTLAVSTMPDETFGPYSFGALRTRLTAATLLPYTVIRDLIQGAWCAGTASCEGTVMHTTAPMED